MTNFFAYVSTQFGATVKEVQCDNGREFDNSSARTFFLTRGMHLRMSCPYTSSQNGKAERIIRSTNNIVRCLLLQAGLPPSYWVEGLHAATYLLNRLPTKTLQYSTPHMALFATSPSYEHLRVFGCRCYPNLSATAPHKLAPRSVSCVFLGYSQHHKGYRCLDPISNKIIISRHVIFDESSFPFLEQRPTAAPPAYEFLEDFTNTLLAPIGSQSVFSPAGSPLASVAASSGAGTGIRPTASAPAPAAPHAATDDSLAAPRAASFGPSLGLSPLAAPRAAPASLAPRVATDVASSPPFSPVGTPSPAPGAAMSPFTIGVLDSSAFSPAAVAASPPTPSSGLRDILLPAKDVRFVYSRRPTAPAPVESADAPAPSLPKGAVAVPERPSNQHSMVTRAKHGFRVPSVFHAFVLNPIPKSFRSALADPQ